MKYCTEFNTVSNDRIYCVVGIKEIVEIDPPEDCVLISITEPSADHIDKETQNRYIDCLNIQFWDVTEQESKDFYDRGIYYDPITDEQANQIRDFIIMHLDKRFAIHCKAGKRRSSAVAKAILHMCNEPDIISSFDRYTPNETVFDKIVGKL